MMSDGVSPERRSRTAKRHQRAGRVADGGLVSAVRVSGRELNGMSVKWSGVDVLLTLRATAAGNHQVCFVGAEDLAGAMIKAHREAHAGKLNWRQDKFRNA